MSLLLLALGVWVLGAVAALALQRWQAGALISTCAAVTGGLATAWSAGTVLRAGVVQLWLSNWQRVGEGGLRLDPLAAAFLLPLGIVAAACAVFGLVYLRAHVSDAAVARSFASYNALLASMALVLTANNLVLLIIAWELMTLTSWALVVSDHSDPTTRAAGLLYLIAGHLGTAALLLLVLFIGVANQSFRFDTAGGIGAPAGLLFVLMVIAFGTKAGIFPFHVWLPDAHPAAPSHVSALMSASMITMGFYGLIRFITLGEPSTVWAYTLIFLGACGAVGGIAFAIAQRDVKRLLAYSTVENAGIATIGIGLGLLGDATGNSVVAAFGWAAAFLHIWSHALVKAGLFIGFGAIVQAAGTRQLDQLGGVLRAWPLLGGLLVFMSAAMVAIPGLNLFASEWLLLNGLLQAGLQSDMISRAVCFGAVVALSLTAATAIACFTRIVGVVLLGSSRSADLQFVAVPGRLIWGPVGFLAGLAVLISLAPQVVVTFLSASIATVSSGSDTTQLPLALSPLRWLLPVLVLAAFLAALLSRLRRSSWPAQHSSTWGCGYPAPTPAMQYTGTSYSEPLTRVLQPMLRTKVASHAATAFVWPNEMTWESRTPDRVLSGLYQRIFAVFGRVAARIRRSYRPSVTLSMIYIVVTVLLLTLLLFVPAGP